MGGASRSIVSEYDANGNRTLIVYPLAGFPPYGSFNLTYRFVHDGADRLVAGTYVSGGALAGWQYDPRGRPHILTRYGAPVTTLGYDAASRLETLAHDLAGSAGDVTFGFAFNPASQIAAKSASNDSYASSGAYTVSRTYAVNGRTIYRLDALARRHGNCASPHPVGPILRAGAELGSRRRDGRISAREDI